MNNTTQGLWILIVVLGASSSALAKEATQRLTRAVQLYEQARYPACVKEATGLDETDLQNKDTALFIECQCRFYAQQIAEARTCFRRLIRRHPRGTWTRLSRYRVADCEWDLGKRQAAAHIYAQAARIQADPWIDPAVGLYRRAVWQMEKTSGQADSRLWVQLRTRHPDHPLAGRTPAETRLTFGDALTVATALHQARQWEQALAVLDLAEPGSQLQMFQLAYRTGRILFDMRDRYPEASRILTAARKHAPGASEAEEAWFYASRALGRQDLDDQAVSSHLAMVRRYPRGQHADRALYYAGWLEHNQGRCEQALPVLRRVGKEYPRSRWFPEADWTRAWCHIRGREWQKAIDTLAPRIKGSRAEEAGRALYWTGIACRALGRSKQAISIWRTTIRRFPLTWYALLARLRLNKLAPPLGKPPPRGKPARTGKGPNTRTQELIRAGLGELASRELRFRERGYLDLHPTRQARLELMQTYRKAGDFHRPWFLTLRYERGALRRVPTPVTRAIWEHSYPPCARDLLRNHADSDTELVLLLQAIMRTESGFDPMALSVANARGLMQMIPPTARKVAESIGVNYADDKLFDPEFNIRTAAWYISRLVKMFHRQWPLAAAAYNAGAPAMKNWCKQHGHLSLDAFVESIPWTESRRYAKRVTAALARYAYLTGAPLPELSLRVRADFLDLGIDY